MKKSSQIAWKIFPLRHFFPLKVVPLIEILLYKHITSRGSTQINVKEKTAPMKISTIGGRVNES
jgi:hypothetical protein